MLGLTDQTATRRLSNAVAAGTTAITSSSVDMAGFCSALFHIHLGAIVSGGVQSAKLQGSNDDSTYADIEGSSVTIADTDDNGIVQMEIVRPTYRYYKVVVSRATQNTTVDSISVTLSNPLAAKPTATTLGNEQHVSAGAGTA